MTAMVLMPVAEPLVTAWLDTSDLGNAKRLVTLAAGKLKWVEDIACWAWYDGRRFSIERGAIEAQRLAHRVIEHIDAEAQALGAIAEKPKSLKEQIGEWCTPEIAGKRVETLRGHAVRSGSAGMTGGMLKQARSFLACQMEEFDQDPLAYNCLNRTLRFRPDGEGKWRVGDHPHDPADMLMQLADVEYVPDAACPFWEERLALLTPDAEQLGAFRTLYGYTLTGLTSDQAFYVHQGKGGDGKSATHQAVAELHGDYFRHAGVKTFLQGSGQRGGAEHRSDLVRLRGDIRFVTCDEPPPRSVFDGETIKQVTGSLVTARGANAQTEVTYRPRFKLFAECNIIPRAPSDDKGFRRRFKLYMWMVSLPEPHEKGHMPIDLVLDKLRGERSGILNWMIAGALEWLTTRHIPQPSAMAEVLKGFWADSSPMLEWMAEWCDLSDPAAREPFQALFDHYKKWLEDGEREIQTNKTSFGRKLTEKQIIGDKDSKGNRWRVGIRLRREALFGGAVPDAGTDDASPSPALAGSFPPQAASGAGHAGDDPFDPDDPAMMP